MSGGLGEVRDWEHRCVVSPGALRSCRGGGIVAGLSLGHSALPTPCTHVVHVYPHFGAPARASQLARGKRTRPPVGARNNEVSATKTNGGCGPAVVRGKSALRTGPPRRTTPALINTMSPPSFPLNASVRDALISQVISCGRIAGRGGGREGGCCARPVPE